MNVLIVLMKLTTEKYNKLLLLVTVNPFFCAVKPDRPNVIHQNPLEIIISCPHIFLLKVIAMS